MQEWTVITANRQAERVAHSPVRKPYPERLPVAAAVPAARPAPRARLLPASRIVRDVVLPGRHDGPDAATAHAPATAAAAAAPKQQ